MSRYEFAYTVAQRIKIKHVLARIRRERPPLVR